MDIPTIYKLQHRIDDMASVNYTIPRRYQTTENFKRLQPKGSPKRYSHLDDILKRSRSIPAPNQYENNPQMIKSKKALVKKINFQQLMKKGKYTYIDDIIKAKKKVPLVGKYHLQQQIDKEKLRKYRIIGDKIKQAAPLFRPTYSQSINGQQSLNIGPGCYKDYHKFKIGQGSPRYTIGISKTKQQLTLITEKQKQRSLSLSKLPSAASYNPIHKRLQDFRLDFKNKIKKCEASIYVLSQCTFGKKISLPNLNKDVPGPKYNIINDWVSDKKFSIKGETNNNLLKKIVMNSPKKSIYY